MAAERLRLEMEESKARSSSFLRPSSWTRKDSEEEDGTQEERRSERGERSQEKRRSEGLSSRRSDHGEREDVEGEEGDDDLRPPKHKYAEKDWWLSAGCIVKVMHETLGDGRYFRQKGRILRVEQRYAGYVRMLETGDLIRLDQQMLETVIPNFGGPVRVVLGEWRDHEGQLEGLDEAQYCVHVILTSGPIFKARPNLVPFVVKGLPYEHVCKIMDEEKS
ncbi:dna rna-binding protein kin17 domain-containing protein [Cystoisospora suis]|uniref:Dna rna-binding protein kin17 domain-containing protein n=1 Tax=Cystoisospora suis TaxID=483139 RepID=A0A2C6KUT4_9APIC|nr:dna rna-binding protein kin17 domain-containing protein [Cystoisospora suis]